MNKKPDTSESSESLQLERYREIVKELYQKILLRPVDEPGLNYYVLMLKEKNMTIDDIEKALAESEEGTNIRLFSHYSAQYWNDLKEVQKYINKLSTGNEEKDWIENISERFGLHLPFKNVLIVGCGNGWVERKLFDLGIGSHFDAFDISEKYLELAKQQKGNRPIRYFVDDVNEMKNIEVEKYDAIFNYAVLHHTEKLDFAMKKLAGALKPGGFMFNFEYVGPSRNQYSDEHVKIMEEVRNHLPEQFRTKYALRPPLENFRVEPSEAIHSDLIRPIFVKYFDIIYQRDLNGGIAYQLLWNNITPFKDKSDPEASSILKMILEEDFRISQDKKIPILFWYAVGIPKKRN